MISLVLLLSLVVVGVNGVECQLGFPGKFPSTNVTFYELVANPTAWVGRAVRVEGTVAALLGVQTFTTIELGEPDGKHKVSKTISVAAESDFFTFPLDAVGAAAAVEGVFALSRDQLVLSIVASAAVLSGDAVCKSWTNVAVVQDMEKGDFNPIATMGSGLVRLKPGEMMHVHSTNHSTEIVTVFAGEITLTIYRGMNAPEKHVLKPYSAIMVPHSTQHSVANVGTEVATYLFVHAMVPVHPLAAQHGHHFRRRHRHFPGF